MKLVPASNDGTMKQLFMVFHRQHNTHILCDMVKFTNFWPRIPQHDFIMPPNIRLHRYPHCSNSCKVFWHTSPVLTCRKCTVCQCSWCCMQGISLLVTPATMWSPIYPNLWMCLVRDSGRFIFLTQTLIWSYSVTVLSQLYSAWMQEKELHSHTHFCPGSCPTMTCQTHFDSSWQPYCLLPHIQAAAGSGVPCFDLPLVTKDCKQSQSSCELICKQ
jgi:hypothetical protein